MATALRLDSGSGSCTLWRLHRDQRMPRPERQLRSRDGVVRRGLRRPERAGLRGLPESGQGQKDRGSGWDLTDVTQAAPRSTSKSPINLGVEEPASFAGLQPSLRLRSVAAPTTR